MGLFSKDIKSMEDLLLHGLHDIYYAEQEITKALPNMIDQATNRDLAEGLKNHLEETNKQIERLDQVFKKLGKTPQSTDCPAIDGLIKEADNTAGEVEDKSVLDAAIGQSVARTDGQGFHLRMDGIEVHNALEAPVGELRQQSATLGRASIAARQQGGAGVVSAAA